MKLKLAVSYMAIYLIWGSTYLAISVSIETLPLFFASSTRFLAAGGALMLYSWFKGVRAPTRSNWVSAVRSGFLSFFVSFMALSWAELTLPSSVAALIISIEPAWFVILDWLFFAGGRPTPKTLAAQLIGFAGCAVLIFADPEASVNAGAPRSMYLLSAGAVLLGGFAWVLGSLFARSSDTHPDSGMASGMQMMSGGGILLAASLINRDYTRLGEASADSIAALIYLITFGSIFAYSAFMFLLKTQPTARVASHTFVNPIVAVILGWLFAEEALTPEVAVSAVMIVTSVILTIYSGKGEKA
ncbi:MAG: EamA family transporter [Synergistaceae bacterium]|nr:EamA family transporter [Synergistaceae bacterium]